MNFKTRKKSDVFFRLGIIFLVVCTCLVPSGSSDGTPPPTFTPAYTPTPVPPNTYILVPQDYPSIQEALLHAVPGTKIQVAPGVYRENLSWPDIDDITLSCQHDPGSVTIDGDYRDRVIEIKHVSGAVIRGFRITRGIAKTGGAGIYVEDSSLLLVQCDIFANIAESDQGKLRQPGIACIDSELRMSGCHVHNHIAAASSGSGLTINSPNHVILLENCLFTENANQLNGALSAGVSLLSGTLVARHCQFISNTSGWGAALYLHGPALIENCLITDSRGNMSTGSAVVFDCDDGLCLYNTISDNFQGGIQIYGVDPLIQGNIVTGNITWGIKGWTDVSAHLSYNDVWNNGVNYMAMFPDETDICLDPLFAGIGDQFYFLSHTAAGQTENSPCIDAGAPETVPVGYTRTDGLPDIGLADLGYHRRLDLPEPIPTWTPVPPTASPGTPTNTPIPPTSTPTRPPDVIVVPDDFPSIQIAVDAAINGDTILVRPGLYSGPGNMDISFKGKQITLQSMDGAERTFINCQGTQDEPHRGFIFENRETNASVLDGFTIIYGHAMQGGGIMVTLYSAPTIKNCIISNCSAVYMGGGLSVEESDPVIQNITIQNCSAGYGGSAAVFMGDACAPVVYRSRFCMNRCSALTEDNTCLIKYGAHPQFTSCEFSDNNGIALLMESNPNRYLNVSNCLFTQNIAGSLVRSGHIDFVNCTFSGQQLFAVEGDPDGGIVNLVRTCFWGPNDLGINIHSARYSNIPPDIEGQNCFYLDPEFVSGPFGDYYIKQYVPGEPFSPNLDTGGEPAYTVSFTGPHGSLVPLNQLTTDRNERLDDRFADIGYHYNLTHPQSTPTPQPPERPIIEDILGSTQSFNTSSTMTFFISAHVTHPKGLSEISEVTLYWENFPTPWDLYDDGTHGDTVAGDGCFSRVLQFAAFNLPPYDYYMNIVAFSRNGKPSETMPYIMRIEGITAPEHQPEITGRHVWFSPVTPGENEPGLLWILVHVDHPNGLEAIDHVDLTYLGEPTGLRLSDNGMNGDLDAGDGYYGIMLMYNGLQFSEPVDVVLGVQAVDKQGRKSREWVLEWKTRDQKTSN